MPLNGSGGATQPTGSIYPAVASTLIESGKFNTSLADVYSILSSAIYKDGQSTTTAAIPFAQGINTNTISERTSASGVTIDSALVKDGTIEVTQIRDDNQNEAIIIATTASAVNEITVTNAAASGEPSIAATGDDTDIDLVLVSKGAGHVTAADDDFAIKGSADGTKRVRFEVDGITTGTTRVITVPDYDVSLANIPPGTLIDYAGDSAPSGWLECDGSNVSRTTYSALHAVLKDVGGTDNYAWGNGDGSTTFTLPDFRRRVAVGAGGSGTGTLGNAVGNTGGAETHTLTIAEMPAHTHPFNTANNTGANGANQWHQASTNNGLNTNSSSNTGGGGAHNNVQPSVVITKLIKI